MIRGDDDVSGVEQSEFVESGTNSRQIVVRIADGGERSRAVDAGNEAVQAVALIVLAAIGIARPEHQDERLVALFE